MKCTSIVWLVVLWCALFLISRTHVATAITKLEGSIIPICPGSSKVELALRLIGFHIDQAILQGSTIQISADISKITVVQPKLSRVQECETFIFGVSDFRWELISRPSGSTSSLTPSGRWSVSLTPDITGVYTVRFIPCPQGCVVGRGRFFFPGHFIDLSLTAQNALAFPPQRDPVLPPQTSTNPDPDLSRLSARKCNFGGGVVDPQWVTVNPWRGPLDYELLEGKVTRSRISRQDNPTNHNSQDMTFHVEPDPPFRRLLQPGQADLEVEWERNHFPEPFWPTAGDRVSVIGYWIHDCGHDFKTEIHPPVMLAVQRPRPILIPENRLFRFRAPVNPRPGEPGGPAASNFGSNVYVPGIVTDIWINQNSGAITSCNGTALHQPSSVGPFSCIPKPGGAGPSPLNRRFEFNIFVPPDPEILLAENNLETHPIPFLDETLPHPFGAAGGPEPTIEFKKEGNVVFLKVTIDLSSFTGAQYARRIVTGWLYPSPDNWGLRRWKLRLNSLDVHNDGDGRRKGDGDWRFWVNTNNTTQEWTKLFDCGGCVHGTETFAGRPWQTGTSGEVLPDRSLGPDLLLFPGQRMWVHTSGFEGDWVVSDDTGAVNDLFPLPDQPSLRSTRSVCGQSGASGCAEYTLNYEVLPGEPVQASLSPIPKFRIYDRVVIRSPSSALVASRSSAISCEHCGIQLQSWYPFDTPLEADPLLLTDTILFEPGSPEQHALTGISTEALGDLILQERQTRPQDVNRFLRDLRATIDAWMNEHGIEDIALELALLKAALPADLVDEHLSDLPLPVGDPDGDGDIDNDDLTILLADRNKSVGASACGTPCDLDHDGVITALDARLLVTLCTRPRCATQ